MWDVRAGPAFSAPSAYSTPGTRRPDSPPPPPRGDPAEPPELPGLPRIVGQRLQHGQIILANRPQSHVSVHARHPAHPDTMFRTDTACTAAHDADAASMRPHWRCPAQRQGRLLPAPAAAASAPRVTSTRSTLITGGRSTTHGGRWTTLTRSRSVDRGHHPDTNCVSRASRGPQGSADALYAGRSKEEWACTGSRCAASLSSLLSLRS
jgi:hypothetical protein